MAILYEGIRAQYTHKYVRACAPKNFIGYEFSNMNIVGWILGSNQLLQMWIDLVNMVYPFIEINTWDTIISLS